MVSIAESAYDQLSRAFNYQIKEPMPLIFYSTHSAFEQNNVILNFIPEGVGAFASPARFRMVLPVDVAGRRALQLISHELTHIFQYHILFQGSLAQRVASGPPTWFMEGMASYMAKDETLARQDVPARRRRQRPDPVGRRGRLRRLLRLPLRPRGVRLHRGALGQGGLPRLRLRDPQHLRRRVDRAIKRAFRIDAEDFDIEFRRWLRKKYLPELVKTGEPSDFGRVFRVNRTSRRAPR